MRYRSINWNLQLAVIAFVVVLSSGISLNIVDRGKAETADTSGTSTIQTTTTPPADAAQEQYAPGHAGPAEGSPEIGRAHV